MWITTRGSRLQQFIGLSLIRPHSGGCYHIDAAVVFLRFGLGVEEFGDILPLIHSLPHPPIPPGSFSSRPMNIQHTHTAYL